MIKELLFEEKAPHAARPEDLAVVEAKLGLRLPPTFIEFCSQWNGGYPDESNCYYPVPAAFREFHEEYKESGGVVADILLGVTGEFPQCNMLEECILSGQYAGLVLPITVDLFGNQAVLRVDSLTGMVFWLDHELWEIPEGSGPIPHFPDRPRLMPIAPDLETFYNSLAVAPSE